MRHHDWKNDPARLCEHRNWVAYDEENCGHVVHPNGSLIASMDRTFLGTGRRMTESPKDVRKAKAKSLSTKARIVGWHWRVRHRLGNIVQDICAVLADYCNESPFRAEPGKGGYSFWRCCREAGHPGLHRFRNYEWGEDKQPHYTLAAGYVDQPKQRHPSLTRRQRRAVEAWHSERRAAS